nr:MAG TPA: hypothetical protein [Caudoviricetes sp.]
MNPNSIRYLHNYIIYKTISNYLILDSYEPQYLFHRFIVHNH